jgi:hypothetical protein
MFAVFCYNWEFSTQSGLRSDKVPGKVPYINLNSNSFIAVSMEFLWKTNNHKARGLKFLIRHSCFILNIYFSYNNAKCALMLKLYFYTRVVIIPTCFDLS